MTETGGTDPNAPGWGAPQQQPQPPGWGAPQQQPAWGAEGQQPGWGAPPPGYGGGYAPPQGYGGAGYGYYGAPQTDGKAIGALVCAIASWVICPFIPAVVAVILAGQSARDIRNSGGRLTGEGMNTAARVIAWINIGLSALGLIILFAAFATSATTSPGY